MNRSDIRGLAGVAAMVIAAGAASANVVVNGGFESPINPSFGWTQDIGAFNQASSLAGVTPHSGSFFAGTQFAPRQLYTGSMSQVLPLNAGDVVDFAMFYQHISGIAEANLHVVLDGRTIYDNTVGATSTSSWQNVSVASIAIGSANPTLAISVTGNSRSTIWMLDDVSVNVVPAPGVASLLCIGGLVATRRRRA